MQKVKEFLLINLGLLLVAAGIHFFKGPNNFATGGVSGIAIISSHYFPNFSIGPLMLIINIILMLIGLIFLGFNFGSKTVYSSFALSGMVWVLEKIAPMTKPFTNDLMLELVFAIILPAVGSAIVFNQNASTGGTDIVAKILNKYTHLHIGKTLLMSDFVIALFAGVSFGIKIGMYSVLGLFLKAFLIDLVIESMNISKELVIISEKHTAIKDFILKDLKRGATIYKATGAFTGSDREVISTIVNRAEAVKIRKFIREVDKKAFVSINNTSEIIGKGFRNIEL